jgi:hypothetical protein
MSRPESPSKRPGSTCLTWPYCWIWRRSLARNAFLQIVELSHTTATCDLALVMATFMRLLSPRNPTAPKEFDRTWKEWGETNIIIFQEQMMHYMLCIGQHNLVFVKSTTIIKPFSLRQVEVGVFVNSGKQKKNTRNLTIDITTASASLPWKLSMVEISTPSATGYSSSLSRNSCTCAMYGDWTTIEFGETPSQIHLIILVIWTFWAPI